MTLFRPGLQLTADRLNGVLMDWAPLTSIGTFASGFAAGSPVPRMRKIDHSGTEVWEFEGEITIGSFTAGSTATAFTFDAGYRVADTRGVHLADKNGGFYGVRVALLSDGVLQFASADTPSAVMLDDLRITNPEVA